MSNPKDFLEQQANGAVLLAKTEPSTPAPRPNGRDHDEPLSLEVWDAGDDNEPIPPRGWLLGNILCRRFLTAILGDGAVGKTALIIAIALSLATARPLIGERVFQRCRVLLLCFEDGKDELRRRVRAATLHHGIATDDIKGQLFLSAVSRSSLKLARMTKGAVEVGRLGELIETEIARHQIDVVLFDPFVKTHAVSENDNAAIDFVAEILTALTIRHDIAVGVLHHTRKGAADPGDADAGRGASALKNAARLVYTITGMTDEAKLYNIAEEEAKQFIRLDNGKVNLIRGSKRARWFKLVGVKLNNCTTLYPHGDEVQTVEPWTPADLWEHISTALANQILDQIEAGPAEGRRYSIKPQSGKDRGAWAVVMRVCGDKLSKEQCNKVIKTWAENGLIEERDYDDPVERKPAKGAYVISRPGAEWRH